MTPTNPARLLHRNLKKLRQSRGDKAKVRDCVAGAFALDPKDDVGLRRALVAFDKLFESVEAAVRRLPATHHEPFLRNFPVVRKQLANLHLENPAPQSFNFLSDVVLENLDLAANRIGEDLEEAEISEEEIKELARSVEELLQWLESASLDDAVRVFSIDVLEILRQALVEYRIRGIEGLQRGVEESVGKLLRYHANRPAARGSEAVQRVGQVIWKFDAIASRALTYGPYLPEVLQQLLPDTFQKFLG